ncbi:MAG: DUF349 domain-containing protein [Gammaproteobacteria bacterium]|nr:DUF349 domain-containing protein [Gammaproteobacteria bacterium]
MILRRWLRRSSRLTHPDSKIRLTALAELDATDPQQQSILLTVLRDDADDIVRKAALQKVTNLEAVRTCLQDDVLAAAAQTRLVALLRDLRASGQHPSPLPQDMFEVWLKHANGDDLAQLLPLAVNATQLAELAIRCKDQREQILNHPLLEKEADLQTLERISRGRDKFCNRHARDRLETMKQRQAQCVEKIARLTELDTSITKALKTHPADHESQLRHTHKLLKLKTMRNQHAKEADTLLESVRCAGGETGNLHIPASPLDNVTLDDTPKEDPFLVLVGALEQFSTRLTVAPAADENLKELAQTREHITSQWLGLADTQSPTSVQHQTFERVSRSYQNWLGAAQRLEAFSAEKMLPPPALSDQDKANQDKVPSTSALKTRQDWQRRWRQRIKNLAWPDNLQTPGILSDVQKQLGRIEVEIASLQTSINNSAQALEAEIATLSATLEEQQYSQSLAHMKRVRALIKQIPSVDHETQRTIAMLSSRLNELRDWQKFATQPKRLQLITELEKLANQQLEPIILADHIRAIRDQWRQLGHPKSSEERDQQLAFDTLAEQTFAPCKAYYKDQASIRAENLAARKALSTQLAAYLDTVEWQDTDLKAAEKILRTARDEWRKFHPCDRQGLKPVQQQFDTLQETLHGQLKARWAANAAAKGDIVGRASALLTSNLDIVARINETKNLQQEWQRVGPVPRSADQRLWKEFRKACDEVFASRDADTKAKKEAHTQQLKTLEQAILDFSNKTQLAIEQNTTTAKELSTLLAGIRTLPYALRVPADLTRDIANIEKRYRTALTSHKQRQQAQHIIDLSNWDQQVSSAEQSGTSIEAPHPWFELRVAAQSEPEDWHKLTIEAEVVADLPSPVEDQNARMALQIQMMNTGIRNTTEQDPTALLKRWCTAGPKDEAADALRSRFFTAIRKQFEQSKKDPYTK